MVSWILYFGLVVILVFIRETLAFGKSPLLDCWAFLVVVIVSALGFFVCFGGWLRDEAAKTENERGITKVI